MPSSWGDSWIKLKTHVEPNSLEEIPRPEEKFFCAYILKSLKERGGTNNLGSFSPQSGYQRVSKRSSSGISSVLRLRPNQARALVIALSLTNILSTYTKFLFLYEIPNRSIVWILRVSGFLGLQLPTLFFMHCCAHPNRADSSFVND